MGNITGKEDFEGYMYFNVSNITVSWNIVRGFFCSANLLPADPSKRGKFLSAMMAGAILEDNKKRIDSERKIDSIRKSNFPGCVSRLTGIFVFDEIDSIARTWDGNADWGEYFDPKNIADVGVGANVSTRADSNWILKIINGDGSLTENWEAYTNKYWGGEVCPYFPNPIWERIVDGYITVWSNCIRNEALANIEASFPKSLPLLQLSSIFAAEGRYEGIIAPYSIEESGNISVNYVMIKGDMENFNTVNCLLKKQIDAPKMKTSVDFTKNYVKNGCVNLPDLRNFFANISFDD